MPSTCGASRLRARSSNMAARVASTPCCNRNDVVAGEASVPVRLRRCRDVLEMVVDRQRFRNRLRMPCGAVVRMSLRPGRFSIAAPAPDLAAAANDRSVQIVPESRPAASMFGPHPAHGCAVALVVIFLKAKASSCVSFRKWRCNRGCENRLLPKIQVVRVKRVVEVEHPRVDREKLRGAALMVDQRVISVPEP